MVIEMSINSGGKISNQVNDLDSNKTGQFIF